MGYFDFQAPFSRMIIRFFLILTPKSENNVRFKIISTFSKNPIFSPIIAGLQRKSDSEISLH